MYILFDKYVDLIIEVLNLSESKSEELYIIYYAIEKIKKSGLPEIKILEFLQILSSRNIGLRKYATTNEQTLLNMSNALKELKIIRNEINVIKMKSSNYNGNN